MKIEIRFKLRDEIRFPIILDLLERDGSISLNGTTLYLQVVGNTRFDIDSMKTLGELDPLTLGKVDPYKLKEICTRYSTQRDDTVRLSGIEMRMTAGGDVIIEVDAKNKIETLDDLTLRVIDVFKLLNV